MITQHRCWLFGDNISTDDIFPQRYLLKATSAAGLAAHVFEDVEPAFATDVQLGDVLVAGENFGCGSCRDQASTALKAAGVSVVIAASFHEFYFRNCVSFGILPIVMPELRELVKTGDWLWIDRKKRLVIAKGQIFVYPRLTDAGQVVLNAGGVQSLIDQRGSSANLPL